MHTTQKTNNMEEKKEQRKFEFTLYLNDNIIVQRFFNIIGFNNKAINSMNFKYAIDENVELIQSVLKDRALDFITEHQRHFLETPDYEQNGSKDMMKIVVKHDGNVIAYREWDARGHQLRSTRNLRGRCFGLFSTGASVTRIDQTAMGEMLIRYDNGVKGYGARNEHVEELHGTIS